MNALQDEFRKTDVGGVRLKLSHRWLVFAGPAANLSGMLLSAYRKPITNASLPHLDKFPRTMRRGLHGRELASNAG